MRPPVRVLIADDSRSMRGILVALLRADPGITVVGEAADGVEVVELARSLRPDIITMDVKMPRMTGLEAIGAIMSDVPSRILVVCAVDDDSQVDLSFRAVAAGALELIAKPIVEVPAELEAWGALLRESVRLMAEVPVVGRRRGASAPEGPGPRGGRIDALGVVASTGGPPAVASILSQLPRDLPIPLFVAQHMTPGFGEGLCRWLNAVTQLNVLIPASGVASRPGHVYLARDEHDLTVDREGIVRHTKGDRAHCPSANALLESLAAAYGSRACALVLTGMGDDGALGVKAILDASGLAFAQDEASSVVFGMPRAAVARGATSVEFVRIAGTIVELARPRRAVVGGAPV